MPKIPPALKETLRALRSRARPDQLEGMARFGITGENRLGVSVPDLRKIARETGKDHALALALWATGIPDARILASMIDDPQEVTGAQMERWVNDFASWDVCDQVCMNLFEKAPPAREKLFVWAARSGEFVRRAAFALVACLAWHDKTAPDAEFARYFPLIAGCATDERNYVRKAVSWALRNIGKRNARLNAAAVEAARKIARLDSRAARWVAADALRELESEAVRRRVAAGVRGKSPGTKPRGRSPARTSAASRPRRASPPRTPRSGSCRPPSPGRGPRRPSS
jgi:3-methyladenine DNA glycosylase AlkD